MNEITLDCCAKVNLTLDILGKREDGYHEVKMIMQSIDLKDSVVLKKNNTNEIEIETNLRYLPRNEGNVAYKMAQLFFDRYGIDSGISINITKKIPVAAGMAGGSANAAAVLVGLDRLFSVNAPIEELKDLGSRVGADVPFSMLGGTMLSTGRGEVLSELSGLPDCYFVIVKPKFSVSTKDVYSMVRVKKIFGHPDTDGVILGLEDKNLCGVTRRMYNVLQEVTEKRHPVITEIQNKLLSFGAMGAIMSGSGPTVFGIFDHVNEKCVEYFKNYNHQVFVAKNTKQALFVADEK